MRIESDNPSFTRVDVAGHKYPIGFPVELSEGAVSAIIAMPGFRVIPDDTGADAKTTAASERDLESEARTAAAESDTHDVGATPATQEVTP